MDVSTVFHWGPLSRRQKFVMTWWTAGSPYEHYSGIIADGSIRSGKTISMAPSFVFWAMENFNGQQFGMAGKTVGSLRRNVLNTLKKQLKARGYSVHERRGDNLLIVRHGLKSNLFYLFGGKDESSQDLIQGVTLAGMLFDEVALMPQSFVNQATGRCSVEGAKLWFNCNPAGPQHWFYQDWVLQHKRRKMVYLHFQMEDNLTLSKERLEWYRSQYSGTFYDRYILGLWVMAEGLIYDGFNRQRHVINDESERCNTTEGKWYVSSDFGIQNATTFLLWRRQRDTERWICVDEYYYSGRDEKRQKPVAELVQGLKAMCERHGAEPERVIVDPSAAALIVELKKNGFHVKEADNDVLDGIADVATMLSLDRLAFWKGCTHTIEEFQQYAWDPKAADRGEDKPIKTNDHCMDAIRYFVRTMRFVKKDKGDKGPYRSIMR